MSGGMENGEAPRPVAMMGSAIHASPFFAPATADKLHSPFRAAVREFPAA